jgi:hypothetical protein
MDEYNDVRESPGVSRIQLIAAGILLAVTVITTIIEKLM